jgi:hypothetical protein
MKGFITVTRHNAPFLISLNAIATVSKSDDSTRIVLLVTERSGEPEKFFVETPFEEVLKLIEQATQ